MEGWVELGDRLHTEMVYPPTDGNPSKSNPAMHGKLATIWSRVRRPNHYFTKPTKYQNLSKIATIWVIGEDTLDLFFGDAVSTLDSVTVTLSNVKHCVPKARLWRFLHYNWYPICNWLSCCFQCCWRWIRRSLTSTASAVSWPQLDAICIIIITIISISSSVNSLSINIIWASLAIFTTFYIYLLETTFARLSESFRLKQSINMRSCIAQNKQSKMSSNALSVSALEQVRFQLFAESVKQDTQ